MLRKLIIKNFVLIEYLVLDFHPGFTSITGETGAGKSILLGAINLLMGQRADTSSIRVGAEKCVIEAHFEVVDEYIFTLLREEEIEPEDGELIVRREITNKGKNRSFVNDTPASLSLLKELGVYLIDIHSQHKNLLINNAQFQLSVLDLYRGNTKLRDDYHNAYEQYLSLHKQLEALREKASRDAKERDYLLFQYNQLSEANLQDKELETLEDEELILAHANEIKSKLSEVYNLIEGDDYCILQSLASILDRVHSIEKYHSEAEAYLERLQSVKVELRDLASDIESTLHGIEDNPTRLNEIRGRIDLLNSLLTKHGLRTMSELIDKRNELEKTLDMMESYDEQIRLLERACLDNYQKSLSLAEALHQERLEAAREVEQLLIEGLIELGIPYIRLLIQVDKTSELSRLGCSRVEYLFSANKETPLERVADIASGGEIARFMLVIKSLIANRRKLPTIIFDEIDTGVSGDIAGRIGRILQRMGSNMQVMAVTHLPQIAATGLRHLYVYKDHEEDVTLSHIRYLEQTERIEEIARMQSGTNLNDITLAAARELLERSEVKTYDKAE